MFHVYLYNVDSEFDIIFINAPFSQHFLINDYNYYTF